MTLIVEATYENGVLRPLEPLPLKEHDQVRITIEPLENPVELSYGMLGWKGDSETLERFAEDPELDPQAGP